MFHLLAQLGMQQDLDHIFVVDTFPIEDLRKSIETVGNQFNALFPKMIHAITAQEFKLKMLFFVLAFVFCALFG